METKNVGGRDRTLRAVLAVVLAIAALVAFNQGNRAGGALAGVGAIGLAINALTCFCGLNAALGIDTTSNADSSEP